MKGESQDSVSQLLGFEILLCEVVSRVTSSQWTEKAVLERTAAVILKVEYVWWSN